MTLSFSNLPPIDTERLHIRRIQPADAEAFADMTNEPTILEAVHFLDHPLTAADAKKLICGDGDGRDCFWGIWTSDVSHLVGTVGTHLHHDEIEIGYWLATAAQGRGLASEAVCAVVSGLANAYPGHRIFAECRLENAASRRLLERIGFQQDGTAGLRPGRRRFILAPRHQLNATSIPSSAPKVTSAPRL